ncbi:type II and III secretion system protein family protein [Alphaproteobacteria bacterium HT1-32]|nr:type II and III secretion system protein family protein [Alphaproteobacteria bacterium HT1-32]
MTARYIIAAFLTAAFLTGLTVAMDPAFGASVVAPEGEPLLIEVHKGKLVRLPAPASTVFVADPEIADVQIKSPTLLYVFARRAGETSLFAVDSRDRVLAGLPITVTHNVARLRRAIFDLSPQSDVSVDSLNGNLVLSGKVASALEAENLRGLASSFVGDPAQIINRMSIDAATQVNLRVRVAEMSRDVTKTFGINWDAIYSAGAFSFGLATGNPVFAAGSFLSRTPSQSTNFNTFGRFSKGNLDLNILLDAMDTEGLISILAEPNLTAKSGEPASFLAGGEFPILVPESNGRVSVTFKQFGVSLGFTPTILGDRISLKVRPEVSQLSNAGAIQFNGFSVPALTTRRAETTVDVASGQSFAIAGLLQNNINDSVSQFPGLGEVPVLGALFRSDQFSREETELVIIVTPYLVKPVSSPAGVASPLDGYAAPRDRDRLIDGAAHDVRITAPTLASPAGFKLTD